MTEWRERVGSTGLPTLYLALMIPIIRRIGMNLFLTSGPKNLVCRLDLPIRCPKRRTPDGNLGARPGGGTACMYKVGARAFLTMA
jgi:hypothetical protein